ncbi:hypothetical protein JHK84_050018 [Glycine max]|nr:hypothetical protein JHK84_050018 [Glycine max]
MKNSSSSSTQRKCAFARKCARLVKEQRARFYIMRHCLHSFQTWTNVPQPKNTCCNDSISDLHSQHITSSLLSTHLLKRLSLIGILLCNATKKITLKGPLCSINSSTQLFYYQTHLQPKLCKQNA